MPRYEDDVDGEFDDMEGDEPATIACPLCGAEVFDDAEYCPRCDQYIPADTKPSAGQAAWWWIGLILAGLATVGMVVGC